MAPHAPPAPLSPKKKQGNIALIIHHQKHYGGGGGVKTRKGIINHKNLKKTQLERW